MPDSASAGNDRDTMQSIVSTGLHLYARFQWMATLGNGGLYFESALDESGGNIPEALIVEYMSIGLMQATSGNGRGHDPEVAEKMIDQLLDSLRARYKLVHRSGGKASKRPKDKKRRGRDIYHLLAG